MVCSNVALLLFDTMRTSDETLRVEINQITDWYSQKYKRGDSQALLEVREAEAIREIRDLGRKGVGESDLLVVDQLALPVLAIQKAFIAIRIVEFTASNAGKYRQYFRRVEALSYQNVFIIRKYVAGDGTTQPQPRLLDQRWEK